VKYLSLFFVCVIFAVSCDKGLEPPPPVTPNTNITLTGTVHFTGNWPPQDSARITAVFLVEAAPPFTVSQVIIGLLANTVQWDTLHYKTPDTTYLFFNPPPGTYHYLCVGQQDGDTATTDWRAVGFAHDLSGKPITFNLQSGDSIVQNLYVNFDSLPAQPFIQ